jgi:hypothetical protein
MRTSAGPELKSNQELEQVLGRLKSRGPESNQELEQVLGRLVARAGNV